MEEFYLVGEPIFKLVGSGQRKEFCAPFSQVALCQAILKLTQDENEVFDSLRQEYLAIVWSLSQMGIHFRIVYAHEDEIDKPTINTCISGLGTRLCGFAKDFFPSYVAYPRDFSTVLPGLILINHRAGTLTISEKDGYKIINSPYGEGGRVLYCQKTILVSERLIGMENSRSTPVDPKNLEKIIEV